MTDREKITEILKAYTKKHNISASVVILEEYAEELAKQGFTKPVRCKDCRYFIPKQNLPDGYDNGIGADGLCDNTDTYTYEDDYCSDAK